MKYSGLAIAFALTCGFAHAQEKAATSAQFQTCMENVDLGAMKNTQWGNCYAQELARQDKVLNAAYRELQAQVPTEAKDALVKAQRAWIGYRDSWCRLEVELPNAPGGEVNRLSCLVDMTIAQTNRIKEAM